MTETFTIKAMKRLIYLKYLMEEMLEVHAVPNFLNNVNSPI